jgi:hypothetical protein
MAIYEATAGNTGQALLALANAKGYRSVFYCPEKVSPEKIAALRALGAEVCSRYFLAFLFRRFSINLCFFLDLLSCFLV